MVEDFDLPPFDDNAPKQPKTAKDSDAFSDPFSGGKIDLSDSDLPF